MEQQKLTQTAAQLPPIAVPNNRRIKLANRNQWRCYWCNHGMRPEFGFQNSATIEHLLPRSLGGSNRVDNLQSACARCNRTRGIQNHDEFLLTAKTFPRDRRSMAQADLDHKAAKRKAQRAARTGGDHVKPEMNHKRRAQLDRSAAHKAFKKSLVNPFEVDSGKYKAFEKLRSKSLTQSLTFWQKICKFVFQIFCVTTKNTG
jgi:hypothetical protein